MTDQDETAAHIGRQISDGDRLVDLFGIRLEEIRAGYARCSMSVNEAMANSAGLGHGAATYALADITFAYAANAAGKLTLSTQCTMTYLGAVHMGDTLMAAAQEIAVQGRTCVYDVMITNQRDETVALFRGHGRRLDQVL